jgi:hypothetical protein
VAAFGSRAAGAPPDGAPNAAKRPCRATPAARPAPKPESAAFSKRNLVTEKANEINDRPSISQLFGGVSQQFWSFEAISRDFKRRGQESRPGAKNRHEIKGPFSC